MVSQPTDAVDSQLPADLNTDAEADTTDTVPDIDLNSLRENVSAAAAAAQLNAELTAVKRATGHIPGIQSKLTSIEKAVGKVETLEATNKQLAAKLDALVNALADGSLITQSAAQSLMSSRDDSNAELMARFSELEDRLTSRQPEAEPEVDPATIARMAELNAATASVEAYARSKGVDPASIPDAVYGRALAAHPDDLTAAVVEVAKYVDTQVGAEARRAIRKDANEGATGERSSRRGPVTAEQIKNMSVSEVLALSREDRDRLASQT